MEQRQEVREGTKGALRGFGNKSNMEGNAADEGLSLGLANFRTGSKTGSKGGLRHVRYNESDWRRDESLGVVRWKGRARRWWGEG